MQSYDDFDSGDNADGDKRTITLMGFSVICLLLLNITEHLLKNTEYRGFPVVLSQELRFLVGYVSRRDLSLAISMSVCLSSFLVIHTHYILQSLYTLSCVIQHLQ